MDLSSPLGNVDVSKLSDRDKQELQQFVVNESQKARIQSCASTQYSSPFPLLLTRVYSDPQLDGHVLQEVHPGWGGEVGEVGQVRGAVCEAVRGSVFGCESCGFEGVGEVEGMIAKGWRGEGVRYLVVQERMEG